MKKKLAEILKIRFKKYDISYPHNSEYPNVHFYPENLHFDIAEFPGIESKLSNKDVILISYLNYENWIILTPEEIISNSNKKDWSTKYSEIIECKVDVDHEIQNKRLDKEQYSDVCLRLKNGDVNYVSVGKDGAAFFISQLITLGINNIN